MVTATPPPALPGLTLTTVGNDAVTVKLATLLVPPAFTICKAPAPAVEPVGTTTHACESVHRDGVRLDPVRRIVPAVPPNPVPFAHWVPPNPTGSHCTDVTCGVGSTLRPPDTVTPCTVTSTEYEPPGRTPAGTVATICVSLQLTMPKFCP